MLPLGLQSPQWQRRLDRKWRSTRIQQTHLLKSQRFPALWKAQVLYFKHLFISNKWWSQDRRSQSVIQISLKSWFPNCCILGSAFHSSSLSMTERGSLDWLGTHPGSRWFMGPGVLNDAVHFRFRTLSKATTAASAQDVLKANM